MTNHEPTEKESFVQHFGKKKKAFRMKSWKEEYKKRRERKK
jgi:hypothetical protein